MSIFNIGTLVLATAAKTPPPDTVGLVESLLIKTVGAVVVLLIAWVLAGWTGSVAERAMLKAKLDVTLSRFLSQLARWSIIVIGAVVCLGIFGINTTSLAAAIGAVGIAIGLALQGTLSSFAAGVMLLIFRPFNIGDVIEVGGQVGTVFAIDLFVTKIDTVDKKRVIIPNSNVFGNTIQNITFHPFRCVVIPVGTAYEADLDKARAALERAANGVADRRDDPPPQVVLTELGASSVNWSVRIWADTADFWTVRERLVGAVKRELDSAGVSIPYPQMDVHMKEKA